MIPKTCHFSSFCSVRRMRRKVDTYFFSVSRSCGNRTWNGCCDLATQF